MALSSEALKSIHLRRLATPGRKYYGDDDQVYLGTPGGRLQLLEKASQVVINNNTSNVQESTDEITNNASVMQIKLNTINLGEIAAFAAAN
jgi:hypothetical protein